MAAQSVNVLACDLGASGGRALLGRFDGRRLGLEEIHRFSNDPVQLGDTLYWDFLRLFHEVKNSLAGAARLGETASVAVDSWGVDFGLLDEGGRLLENPVHYRDPRTRGMLELALGRVPRERLYHITGNQFMEINTVFQLLALRQGRSSLLRNAESMLLIPDLFHFFLCGEKAAEASIASTTQLFDIRARNWSRELAGALGLPERIFPPVIPGGSPLGSLAPALCEELGIPAAKVTAVAGHDTQSALVATPAAGRDFIFLSCGTWSLLGTELEEPLINERSQAYNLTNECAYAGRVSFLKNITGLWLVQESRRQWAREGHSLDYGRLEELARAAGPARCYIDPDDPLFAPAGNLPRRIRQYCRDTGQPEPVSEGEVVRCIEESLALKYRLAIGEIEACTGKAYPLVHMVGGGVRDSLLCELTASACGRPVLAGPVEATGLGNAAVQLIALGELAGLEEARDMLRASCQPRCYEPRDLPTWKSALGTFRRVTGL